MKMKWISAFALLSVVSSLQALPKHQMGKLIGHGGSPLTLNQSQKVDFWDEVVFYHEKLRPRELIRMQFDLMNLERQTLEAAEIYA